MNLLQLYINYTCHGRSRGVRYSNGPHFTITDPQYGVYKVIWLFFSWGALDNSAWKPCGQDLQLICTVTFTVSAKFLSLPENASGPGPMPVLVISGPDDWSRSPSFLVLMIGPGPRHFWSWWLVPVPVISGPIFNFVLVLWLTWWNIHIKNA